MIDLDSNGTGFNVDSGIEKKMVKIPGSLLNQKVKRNHQREVQDHFQAQVQFREKDNLPKCQGCDGGQVQVGMMKLKLDFQNDMILGSNSRVRDIRIGQRLTRKTFLALIDQFTHK